MGAAMPLRQRIKALLTLGTDHTSSFSQQRKILHLNATALMTHGVLWLFGLAYLMTGNPALVRMAVFQLPVMVITASVPWLNHRGHHALARWALLLPVTALIVAGTWFSTGSHLQVHGIHIAIAMAAVVLFPIKDWRSVAGLALLNTLLYFHAEFVGVPAPADLLPLSDRLALVFRVGYVSTTILTILCSAWLGEHAVRRNELAFAELSGIDVLTGLPNRRRVMLRLADAIAMSKRIRQYVAVLFLDLDNFKPLNDAHGHEAGDLLLQEVARRLTGIVREMDLAARLGGDEFVAVISHLGGDRAGAVARMRMISDQVRTALAEPYRIVSPPAGRLSHEVVHRCTASIGVALFLGSETDPEAILQRADAAMYRAKAAGRNQVSFDEPG
jgi:diguanylate cyclase (GGDEF)-like protein